jgi:hypothetical protein
MPGTTTVNACSMRPPKHSERGEAADERIGHDRSLSVACDRIHLVQGARKR